MAECTACGAANRSDDRFCVKCGSALAAACPTCGRSVDAGDTFCGGCGTRLGGEESAATAAPAGVSDGGAAAGRERRRVSVLFCDLVGYTSLADGRDPEETRELLSGYFDLARSVIGRYGGVVEKFIGDAVMAVWGVPAAHEDDAERAVRAGLELVDAIPAYGREAGVALRARVGVASGSAATVETTDEGLVVGDRVNLAARVQAAAPAGACYVDDVTRRLVGGAVAFEDTGEHELKGVADPVRLHRAIRVVSWVGGRQRTIGLEAPLVGRDAELRAVKELFHASAERRTPRLVVVSGPAGVGKSRLGWELEKYIDGLVDTVLWHRGRCLSYGEGVSFWALAEMVRQRLAIAEEDPVEVAATKLAEGVVRLVPEGEREYVGARLARLLGVETTDARPVPLPREELFAGWRIFFERLAGVAPVILVVEDAQYADRGLLEFLDHLVDWARQAPIFVVVLARAELTEEHPRFGAGRNRTMLSLDPLDGSSMAQLVDAFLPGIPPRARETITGRAQGVPLFAVETIRSLIDAGLVVADTEGSQYHLVRELEDLQVPDSLQALLAARLDVLDPATRQLLGVASVLGSSFPAEALASVAGVDAGAARAALDELVRRDVLEVTADPLSPQQGDYRFSQELLRQVAYDTLPRRERRARHLTVAAHLRATFANDGEDVAEVIARHYLDALAAGPANDDVPGVRVEAVAMLERAGSRAEASGAPARAATSYATAAALTSEGVGPEAGQRAALLWERAAWAAFVAADTGRSLDCAGEARTRHEAAGDHRSAARTRTIAGRALVRAGRLSEARAQLTEALDVLRSTPDADTVEAYRELAAAELFGGNLEEGGRLATEALTLGEACGVDEPLLARLFITAGLIHILSNHVAQAGAAFREAARIAEQAGDAEQLSLALLDLSDALGGFDNPGSLEAALAAIPHARRLGAVELLGIAVGNAVIAVVELGDWDQAAALLESVADDDLRSIFLSRLADVFTALRGEAAEVRLVLERLAEAGETEDLQNASTTQLARAFAAAAVGDAATVIDNARLVLGHAHTLGVRSEVIRLGWPLAARLASDLGDEATVDELIALIDDQPLGHVPPPLRAERALAAARRQSARAQPGAPEALADAVAALRRLPSPYPLAGGLLDLAEDLARSGDRGGAATAVAEARAIAERLGCRPLLRRADELTSLLPTGA